MRWSASGQPELRIAAAALVLCIGTGTMCASAAPLIPTTSQEDALIQTQFLLGFQWNFGNGAPEFVFGVRSTRNYTDNGAYGGKLDIAVPVSINWTRPVVRVMAVAGVREAQLELGGGARLFDWSPVFAAGLQGPYSNGGANYLPGEGIKPYLGVNDFGELQKPPPTAVIRPPI